MGLKDPKLMKLVRAKVKESAVDTHPLGCVMFDLNPVLHQLEWKYCPYRKTEKERSENDRHVSFVEVYNDLMDHVRSWILSGALRVYIVGEKGVPAIKLKEINERDSKNEATPYGPEWTFYNGCLVRTSTELCSDQTTTRQVIAERLFVVSWRRLMITRHLRPGVIRFFFTECLKREKLKRLMSPRQMVIVDYDYDSEISPAVYNNKGLHLGSKDKICEPFSNQFEEADWAMAYHTARTAALKTPMLVLSIDGDMVAIMCEVVRASMTARGKATALHALDGDMPAIMRESTRKGVRLDDLKARVPPTDEALMTGADLGGALDAPVQVYVFNGLKGAPVVWINAMVAMLANRGWSVFELMLLFHVCGNDYVPKEAVFPGMGAEVIWEAMEKARNTYGSQLLTECLETGTKWARAHASILEAAGKKPRLSEQELRDARELIQIPMSIWSTCGIPPPHHETV